MYSILVVDDQLEIREELYHKIFDSAFNIKCQTNRTLMIERDIKHKYYDCILVDETLSTGDHYNDILKSISIYNIPIIRISEQRIFLSSEHPKNNIVASLSLMPIFKALQLAEEDANIEIRGHTIFDIIRDDFINRINTIIHQYRGDDNNDQKSLSICHISDIQIGDPNYNSTYLFTFISMLKNYFVNRAEKPDLFVFSGDIGFSGKRGEIGHDVYEVIKDCFKAIYSMYPDNQWTQKLLFVPGNHDFNYNATFFHSERSELMLDKNCTPLEIFNDKDDIRTFRDFTPSDFKQFKASEISRYYFSEFCYRLTGNANYWNNPFCIDNTHFMDIGARIIGISNAEKYFDKTAPNGTLYEFINRPNNIYIYPRNFPSIVVGHISPGGLGYDRRCGIEFRDECEKTFGRCGDGSGCKRWESTNVFFESINAIIYLFGHSHRSYSQISKDKRCLYLGAAAPNKLNPNESGFSLISFTRDKSTGNIEVSQNIMQNLTGTFSSSQKKFFKYTTRPDETGSWEESSNE